MVSAQSDNQVDSVWIYLDENTANVFHQGSSEMIIVDSGHNQSLIKWIKRIEKRKLEGKDSCSHAGGITLKIYNSNAVIDWHIYASLTNICVSGEQKKLTGCDRRKLKKCITSDFLKDKLTSPWY